MLARHSKSDAHTVPTLKEMGYPPLEEGALKFPGGETAALERMEHHLKRGAWIAAFEKPKTSPNR